MNVEDMILVSIDHVIEPPDMFERHIPERYRDMAPRIVRTQTGVDQWEFLGTKTGSVGLNAVATWPRDEWSFAGGHLRRGLRRVRRLAGGASFGRSDERAAPRRVRR